MKCNKKKHLYRATSTAKIILVVTKWMLLRVKTKTLIEDINEIKIIFFFFCSWDREVFLHEIGSSWRNGVKI